MVRRTGLNQPACQVCGTSPSFRWVRPGAWCCAWCSVVTADVDQFCRGPRRKPVCHARPGVKYICRVCICETWSETLPKDDEGGAILKCDGCGIHFADATRFMERQVPVVAAPVPPPVHFRCPICQQPPPAWLLTRALYEPKLHACKGCGILFKNPELFYAQPPAAPSHMIGCRKCGSLYSDPVSSAGIEDHTHIARCRGCRTVFLAQPGLWMRNTSVADRKRIENHLRN